jgi:hypothetical protein
MRRGGSLEGERRGSARRQGERVNSKLHVEAAETSRARKGWTTVKILEYKRSLLQQLGIWSRRAGGGRGMAGT